MCARGDRVGDLCLGVLREGEGRVRQDRVGVGAECRRGVDEQRQDRVVVGHGDKLDLAVALEPVVEMLDAGRRRALAAENVAKLVACEIPAPCCKVAKLLVGLHLAGVHPGEVEMQRQVDEVPGREQLRTVSGGVREMEQPLVFGVTANDVLMMDREEPLEDVLPFRRRQIALRSAERDPRVLILRAARVLVELVAQRGDHREVRLDSRVLLEQASHVQVVLRGVETHPRQDDLAALRVLVRRLMHVPEDRDPELAPHADAASRNRPRTNAGSSVTMSHAARGPLERPSSAA